MEIHERFKHAREILSLSQQDMAEIVGISQNAISKIESGIRKKPNAAYIDELVQNQGISYEWLMNGTGKIKNKDKSIDENSKSSNETKVIELLEKILKKEEENGKLMKQLLDSFPKTLSIIENLTNGNMSVNLGKAKAYDRRQLLLVPRYGTRNTAYARP